MIGTISKLQLEYNESRASIPAYNVPQHERGLVHIWGRNNMGDAQRLGIYWLVYDPDGVLIEEYFTWEAWPYTGAGSTHEFIGGRFDLNKAGNYIINVALSMNPSDPVIVDTYYGTLCSVAGEVKTLEVDITPVGTGYVTTVPASEEGKTEWHHNETGTFPYNTQVKVTAIPNTGYVFDHWSDGIIGGVSYSNPSYVQTLIKDRAVKAHFREEDEPNVETLEVDITPVGAGYVTTVPASEEGKTTWHNNETGTFPYGTSVQVTAHPNAGYVFEKWSDKIVGGVSYDNPSYVQSMTQRRTVKCHFREEDEPDLETLEVDITPIGKGYVETQPDPVEGYQKWVNNSTGQFPHGTKVLVTAYPYEGYRFEKWSDKIIGGVSYQNPEYVEDMIERRTVKCHFREEGEEPVIGEGELTAIVIHWQEYTDLLPPATIENRGTYEIHPVCKNISTEAISFRVVATITKPSGAEVIKTDIDGWPYTGAGKEFKPTLNMGDVDEVGTWTGVISLYDHKTDELLDSWSGDLLIVTAAEVGIFDVIGPLLVLGLMAGIMVPMMKEEV